MSDGEISGREDRPLAPGLYLVATPIGNLEDITLRALRILRSVDRIACEDTRQTAKLLHHFGIGTPTVSYHQHNENSRSNELVEALRGGARIAVVSDAGMPGIADPGATIASEAIAAGVDVYPIPGANAALSALIASGLSAEDFSFHGFLPSKEGRRKTALEDLLAMVNGATNSTTHIFYEAPHRIVGTLESVVEIFGASHRVALARELTKLHEEFLRGTAKEVLETMKGRASIRGEMVLLIEGTLADSVHTAPLTLEQEVVQLMQRENASEKDALKHVAKTRRIGKSEAYREWQRIKRSTK